MKNTKLVYLQWCDAMSNNTAWLSIEDAIEWAKSDSWVVTQVGWIIEETDEYILFASKIADETGGTPEMVDGLVKIPTPWVMKRKELKL